MAKKLPPGQVFLKAGAEYEIFALAVFEGESNLQIIEDVDGHEFISWYPAWLFDVIDPSIPGDWICNFFHEEPTLVVGPAFLAQDIAAYDRMVDSESEAVNEFWARVGPRPSSNTKESDREGD
ncbi:MAG: hypothetical protein K8H90_02670 [Thermoanaerobaculia bacterium]|nr:hypothetical protein [Thermoanaerobaculia bacterium]